MISPQTAQLFDNYAKIIKPSQFREIYNYAHLWAREKRNIEK